jgi:hypothetical protein
VVCFFLDLIFDFAARSAAVAAMSYVFGVDTSLASFDTNLLLARAELRYIAVENPPSMIGRAMELDRLVIDLDTWSLMFQPIHLQLMSLSDMHVELKKIGVIKSNLDSIIEHAAAVIHDNDTIIGKINRFNDFRNNGPRVVADKVHFKNITITANISGAMSLHHVPQVLVTDVGRKQGGIHVYDLLEVVVRAIVKAVAVATSHEIQKGVIRSVEDALDYGSVEIDTGGGWVTHSLKTLSNTTAVVGEAVGDAVSAVAAATGHKKWGSKAETWMDRLTSNMTVGFKNFTKNTKSFFANGADRMAEVSSSIKKGTAGENAPIEDLFKDH